MSGFYLAVGAPYVVSANKQENDIDYNLYGVYQEEA